MDEAREEREELAALERDVDDLRREQEARSALLAGRGPVGRGAGHGRNGALVAVRTGRPRVDIASRFAVMHYVGEGGCWIWTGRLDRDGYGYIRAGGKTGKRMRAQRFAYELHVGAIPSGLTLDHLCRNRACVNPAHLEPVTNRENLIRGIRARRAA